MKYINKDKNMDEITAPNLNGRLQSFKRVLRLVEVLNLRKLWFISFL